MKRKYLEGDSWNKIFWIGVKALKNMRISGTRVVNRSLYLLSTILERTAKVTRSVRGDIDNTNLQETNLMQERSLATPQSSCFGA